MLRTALRSIERRKKRREEQGCQNDPFFWHFLFFMKKSEIEIIFHLHSILPYTTLSNSNHQMMSKLSLSFRVRPSILLFGDSITEYGFGIEEVRFGWSSLLSSLYSRRADVLNRGFAGYNTTVSL
jgi:hypothetical protein